MLDRTTNDFNDTFQLSETRIRALNLSSYNYLGFATNSAILPSLVNKGCLVISDELNHASIRYGVRLSRANVRMFKHNNMESLESLLCEVNSQGRPKTHRPWKKILLIVEGLFSKEGASANLPAIMEFKKRYKVFLVCHTLRR